MTEEEKRKRQEEARKRRQAQQASAKARAQQQDAQAAEQAAANVAQEKPQATFEEKQAERTQERKATVQSALSRQPVKTMTLDEVKANAKPAEEHQKDVDAYNRQEQNKADTEWDKGVVAAHENAGTKRSVIKVDPMLEGTSFAESMEKLADAGQLNTSTKDRVSKFATFEQTVDAAKIPSVRDLAYIASSFEDEKKAKELVDVYASHNKLDKQDLYYQIETLSQGRVFSQPQSARGKMEQIGMYAPDGTKLDMTKATPAEMVLAIRSNPNTKDREELEKQFKVMHPEYWSKDMDFSFLESAELTKTDYNNRVDEMNISFTLGATDDNARAYAEQYYSLTEEYADNPRVLAYMQRALVNSYQDRTGITAPTEEQMQAMMQEMLVTEAVPAEGEDRKGFFARMWDATGGKFLNAFKEQPDAPRHEPEVEEVTESAAAAQGGGYGGGYSGGGSASSYAASSGASAPKANASEQAAQDAAAMAAATQETAEVQGPQYQAAQETPEERAAKAGRAVAYNAEMTDAEAYALMGQGYMLDARNSQQIAWTQNSEVRGIMNTVGMISDMGGGASGQRNVVDTYAHYGEKLGNAIVSLNSGSLPGDIETISKLDVGRVVYDIDKDIREGRLSIPTGTKNVYDYALSLPQYAAQMESVNAAMGVIGEVNAAYSEQARLEKEAAAALREDDIKKIMNGTATPEVLERVAQGSGNADIDYGADVLRNTWRAQMGERMSFFSNDGTFWQGDSLAAQEGMKLLRSGGNAYGETFSMYKSALKEKTLEIVDRYTAAANQMDMSLEQYLNSAGITSLDQIINIAYAENVALGNAYAADTDAQAAAQAIAGEPVVGQSMGKVGATATGMRYGAENVVSDFAKASYMIIDDADYNMTCLDLRNDYEKQYGTELAATMYYVDLMDYANSGALSKESAEELVRNMSRAQNIFDIGYEIDPGILEGLMRGSLETVQKDVEDLEAVAAKLPANERRWFDIGASFGSTGAGMGLTAAASILAAPAVGTGAAAWVGAAVGQGLPQYGGAYTQYHEMGMSNGMAKFMAFADAGATTVINHGGAGSTIDMLYGNSAYQTFAKAVRSKSGAGVLKVFAGELKGKAVEEGVEEVVEGVKDYAMFDILSKPAMLIDSGKPVTASAIFGSIKDAVYETNVVELGKELLTNFGAGAAMGGLFSLVGSAKTYGHARRGVKMENTYQSINLATQMTEGNVEFSEENIGKVYSALFKDMEDPKFRKYIDSGYVAAQEQKAFVAAATMGIGKQSRTLAVADAQKARDYSAKAEAAREAGKTAQSRFWELRERLSGGDLSAEVELESARMQWQKAETALAEAEGASAKAMETAKESLSAWVRECRAKGSEIKGIMLKQQAEQIAQARQAAAEKLARRYEAEEAAEPINAPIREQTENAVFGPDQFGRTEVDLETEEDVTAEETMTDEELDSEIASLSEQIGEAEKRVADMTAQSTELELGEDTAQAIADQELKPLTTRRDTLVAREKDRFNNLFERMMQAVEMDNDEAADQLRAEYDSVMVRLKNMGVDTDALVMAQYGVTPENVAASEAQAQKDAEDAEYEKVTASLSRRMEKTAADIEMIQPARRYFMKTPLFVNESQKANLLSADGSKTLSRFNYKYGTKLTDKAEAGAMPLDGHALSDIAAEAAGTVDIESAHPEEELLRIMQTSKKLAADQKAEKAEARELSEKKKAADKKRRESVQPEVNRLFMDRAKKHGIRVKNDVSPEELRNEMELTGEMLESASNAPVGSSVNSSVRAEAVIPKTRADLINNNRNTGVANKAEHFSEAMDAWDDKTGNLNFVVSRTPDVLKNLGDYSLPDGDIVMNSSKIRVNQAKFHKGMTKDVVKKLPQMISDPVMVMESRTQENRIVIVGELNDAKGNPVVAILSLDVEKNKVSGLRTIPMVNAYGKDKSKAQDLFEKSKYLYLNKNRADAWQVSTGLQLPTEAYQAIDSSTSIVAQPNKDVNKNIDALAVGNVTPTQAAKQQTAKGKKLEESALQTMQKLADRIGVGLRVKSDARFQSAGARVSKGVAGYYKNGQRNAVVRSKEAGRLEVAGHEIGHGVQEQLGYTSTQDMIDSWKKHFPNTGAYTPQQYDHEAFAEFFWRYLQGRDIAVAYTGESSVSAFEYALRQNKKMRKAVLNAQRNVSMYFNSSDTSAKIGANIVTTADANKRNNPFSRTAEAWFVDDTAAVEEFQDVIRNRIGEGHLPFDLNLRDTIRYNRRASARAAQCIGEAMVDNNGNVVGESLTDVFSGIKGKDYDLYMRWWLARHSIDRDTRKGKKNQVFAESSVSTNERLKFIAETEAAHPEFRETNERFQKWRRQLMDVYLVSSGLMGDQAKASQLLDMLEEIYPYYAPTKRARKGKAAAIARGVTGQKKYAMHEATGSTEDIIDPFESFVGMVNGIVSMAAENDNKVKFAELYDAFGSRNPGEMGAGVGMFANEITQDMQKNVVDMTAMREKIEKMLDDIDTDPDVIMQISDIIGDERVQYTGKGRVDMNNVISVRGADGKDRYFEVYNPEMFKLLSSVSGQGARDQKTLAQTISMLTRSMSMLTTGSNPVFGITNAMRDFQNSVNYGSWATSYIDGAAKWLATLKDVVTNSEVSQEYDRLGGGGWSQYETRSKKSADRTKSEVFKGYNTKNIGRIGRMAGRAVWRIATMEDVNGWIEKTSRLAEYKYGKHDRSTAEGKIEAFLAAQDVTTDFARRGNHALVHDLKSIVPFFNASLQGIYRNARQFTAQESDRAKIRLAKQITNTALTSFLANALLMEFLDDDEKEEFTYLSQDLVTKHMFIPNFAPEAFGDAMLIRIPLDQNPISYAVNAAVSNMVWGDETGDEFLISMAALSDVIMGNLNPVSSTILDPMVSVMSNKNWYGSKIVPTYLESYDTMNQYTEETPQAFVDGSEVLAGIGVDISPMMLQYLAQQYTGYIGQTLIPALPSEKNKNGIVTGMMNSLAATVRSRVTSDPLKSNDMISMVYDSVTELTQISKAGQSKRDFEIGYLNPALSDRDKKRAIDEAYDLTHKGGALYDAKNELASLDDEIDEINANDKLSEQRKQELIAGIRKEKIEIALDVKEIMDDYNARYKYEGLLPRWFAKQFYK